MLANLPELFDSVLVIVGLALVVSGLVMFIRSKSSTDASSVEAFGIKLNVTHPSLILVLAGVGLMLAPRLLPELPGKVDKPEPAVVAIAPPSANPSSTQPSTPTLNTPTPPTSTSVAPPVTQTKPDPPKDQPDQPPTRTPIIQKTEKTSPKPPGKPAVSSMTPSPTPSRRSSPPHQTPVVAPDAPVTPAPPQADAAKPARPLITYAALGLPTNRDFWSGETRTTYTRRLHTSLEQAGRNVLRMETQPLNLGEAAFDAWWNESNQHPRSRGLCAAANAPRALLSARTETPTTSSVSESAYCGLPPLP